MNFMGIFPENDWPEGKLVSGWYVQDHKMISVYV